MVELEELSTEHDVRKAKRVVRYILLYCIEGSLHITIDENAFTLNGGDVVTITSGQIHRIDKINAGRAYQLTFSFDFFCKDDRDIELIFHNGLFCHFGMNEVIPVDKKLMESELNLIGQELLQQPYQYLISVRSRIELILVSINRAKVSRGDEVWKPDALFLRFLEAVRAHFENNYDVAAFAGLLGTTEKKLNEQAKLHTGKTAQNVIYSLVISEAKRLLIYEDLTVKEIAYKLGFSDPFYFSNFFKKQVKGSPKSFRQKGLA